MSSVDIWVVDHVSGKSFLWWYKIPRTRAGRMVSRWSDGSSSLVVVATGSKVLLPLVKAEQEV